MFDGQDRSNTSTAVPILPMNSNSASPKMKKSLAGRTGSGRPRSRTPQNCGSPQQQAFDGLYQNDRLVNSVTSVLGCIARVTGKSGKQFEGVFKTISPEGSLVLGKASQVDEAHQNGIVDSARPKKDQFEQFVINRKDWVKVEFKDVDLEACCGKRDTFKTDSAIVKKMNGQPRKELEKWVPAGDTDGSLETPGLEDAHAMANGWSADQMFSVNEKKYGVKSTYNEDMVEYTTKLEKRDTPEYREKEKLAAQKAEEIYKESPHERSNIDSGRSEEALYSAVVRNRYDRSTPQNWRNPNQDRPDKEQRPQKTQREGSSSPALAKETNKSPQADEMLKVQTKEKVVKQTAEAPVEDKPEIDVEAVASKDEVKDPKPSQNVVAVKPETNTTKPPVSQTSPNASVDPPKDPGTSKSPLATTAQSNPRKEVEELKEFSMNFKLKDKKSKESGTKGKECAEEDEKTSKEKKEDEKEIEEPQAAEETKTATESNSPEVKVKSSLNPNAQEFRPVKRNSPSPRSSSTPSSGGTPSPYQAQSPFSVSPYPPGNIYSRHRGRGPRGEFVEHPSYVNATNAAGQPFFAQPVPQFVPPPSGIPYIPSGNMRHPGLQPHHVFLQPVPHGQPPVMVPIGAPPYHDGSVYYGPGPPVQMIQSPPQITSPSLQQSQFNFSSTSVSLPPQPVNPVRPVSSAVIASQPTQSVVLLRQQGPNEMPTTSMIPQNRPPTAQSYQGN